MIKKEFDNNMFKRILKYIVATGFVFLGFALIVYSKQVSKAIINSIYSCLTIVIPSLFAFIVVSNLLIKSNIYIYISKPFYIISKYLLRIPSEFFSIFLLSNIGGYPVGAKLLTELIDENKINKKTAEKMICYCYCNSPAFFVGAVGATVFNNIITGMILYISVVLSNFFIGIILGIKNEIPIKTKEKRQLKLNANILIDSINSAAKTIFLICIMLVFFSAIIAVATESGLLTFISGILSNAFIFNEEISFKALTSIIEISTIANMTKYCYTYIPLIVAIVAFGGFCVITQILGITSGKLSYNFV